MRVSFYIALPLFFFAAFVTGFWLGCLFIRYLNKPKEPVDYYDGKHGMGYQPLANQGQQPIPPRSAMPPLKKPKKGSDDICWIGPVPLSRGRPPKPLHPKK